MQIKNRKLLRIAGTCNGGCPTYELVHPRVVSFAIWSCHDCLLLIIKVIFICGENSHKKDRKLPCCSHLRCGLIFQEETGPARPGSTFHGARLASWANRDVNSTKSLLEKELCVVLT
jgi:hypothetical protein